MPRKKNLNDGKRRDDKGRVLRTGEGQRKDGTYEYRFTDNNGKRRSIYDKNLNHLRRKEDEVAGMRRDGIDYGGGEITVSDLLKRYVSLKQGFRQASQNGYEKAEEAISRLLNLTEVELPRRKMRLG